MKHCVSRQEVWEQCFIGSPNLWTLLQLHCTLDAWCGTTANTSVPSFAAALARFDRLFRFFALWRLFTSRRQTSTLGVTAERLSLTITLACVALPWIIDMLLQAHRFVASANATGKRMHRRMPLASICISACHRQAPSRVVALIPSMSRTGPARSELCRSTAAAKPVLVGWCAAGASSIPPCTTGTTQPRQRGRLLAHGTVCFGFRHGGLLCSWYTPLHHPAAATRSDSWP